PTASSRSSQRLRAGGSLPVRAQGGPGAGFPPIVFSSVALRAPPRRPFFLTRQPSATIAAMVPRLKIALVGPLLDLERRILDRMPEIERWLRTKWQEHAVPFY